MFFEDIEVGSVFDSKWREVSQPDIDTFAALTSDHNPIHVDPEFAKSTTFGKPIAHGMLTISIALGLWAQAGYTRDSLVALVSLDNVRFKIPVFSGDLIMLRSVVTEKRESKSRADMGIATYKDTVVNYRGEVVAEFLRTVLLRKKY